MEPALLAAWRFVVPEEVLRTRTGGAVALMHVEDHIPLDRLQEAARRYRNTRTWPRVRAVILAQKGDTAPEIARALGFSRRAIQAWVAAYNRGGVDSLPDRPHTGRAPALPHDLEGRFL